MLVMVLLFVCLFVCLFVVCMFVCLLSIYLDLSDASIEKCNERFQKFNLNYSAGFYVADCTRVSSLDQSKQSLCGGNVLVQSLTIYPTVLLETEMNHKSAINGLIFIV